MVTEHADVGFDPFVIVFYLSLCLWVICGGESLINVKCLKEASGIVSHEGGPPIRVVDPRYPMVLPHVFEV